MCVVGWGPGNAVQPRLAGVGSWKEARRGWGSGSPGVRGRAPGLPKVAAAGLPHHTILPVRDPALEHHPEDHFPLVFSQKAELRDQLQPKNCLETCDLNRSGEPERKLTGRYALDCSPLWTGAQSSWDTRTSGISESSEQEKVSAPAHTSVVNRDPTGVNASHWRVCT